MNYFDEFKSPFQRRSSYKSLIVERYQRWPDSSNSIVTLMLAAINRELPLEAAIVRRVVELGRALTDKEIERNYRISG